MKRTAATASGSKGAVVNNFSLQRIWGEATAFFHRTRRTSWIDLLVLVALFGFVFGLFKLVREWTAAPPSGEQQAEIDLSLWSLPLYTFYSLSRGLIAYGFSLGFTLVYGYWAAKDKRVENILVAILDVLQSIPVLGFLPAFVAALANIVPGTNVGVELAAILMIFTGQAWNMTFSFYHSLKSIPMDQREVATVYRFSWWQRFRWVELPFATVGLVWNSMMSMAGGWFFLMVCETFPVNGKLNRLPGLGSYMAKAVEKEDYLLMVLAIVAMVGMIVALDQFLWYPIVVWAQKFRVEEGAGLDQTRSWFLDWLRRSRLLRLAGRWWEHWRDGRPAPAPKAAAVPVDPTRASPWAGRLSLALGLLLLIPLAYGTSLLVWEWWQVDLWRWLELLGHGVCTLLRVLLAVILGTLWTVPAGLAIGLSSRWRQRLQPVIQVLASFPAPMLFPLVILILHSVHIALDFGSVVLMLLGTQWYILFNVVAGSMAIPADLKEVAKSYRIGLWQRFRVLYLPAIFPYLVTGWVTAAGGAWNASIVSEYVTYHQHPEWVQCGLGAQITLASNPPAPPKDDAAGNAPGDKEEEVQPDIPNLAASVLVMACMVVLFNRFVWRRLYNLAEQRFSLNK
jgi:NitT/TauT family transport system permease protein